ncbi:MAG: zinc-dependent metalloprotease [Thermomicrobiales bacterium]|nr:zinc-dependent metalloprotease [Thermomicrobiales bacterium]
MPAKSANTRRTPSRRLLTTGLLAGVAVGAWAMSRAKPPASAAAEPREMIDWEQARSMAIAMNRGSALTAPERARLSDEYRALVARCIPIVENYTGDSLPATLERTFAFDRVDWINANIEGFRQLFTPLEALNPLTGGAPATAAAAVMSGLNQKVVSAELGVMLGYLGRRVLGQYDLALLGKEPVGAGKLYFGEPNIRMVEQQLGLPTADFRMWLALHETTHAFEFEAHPWVREHFNAMLERYFALLREDAERLRQAGVKGFSIFIDRARDSARGEGGWLEALMNPEQRALFAEMQATMCMVEGYSNHVMNAVGRGLLPTYASIARKFELRQAQKSPAEQIFARLTGLSVKMEQYRLGEAFINRIAEERGHGFAKRIWEGPEFLPTMEEIRNPERWLARIDARDAARAIRLAEPDRIGPAAE